MTQEQLDDIIVYIQDLNARMEAVEKENLKLQLRVDSLKKEMWDLSRANRRLDDRTKDSIRFGF